MDRNVLSLFRIWLVISVVHIETDLCFRSHCISVA